MYTECYRLNTLQTSVYTVARNDILCRGMVIQGYVNDFYNTLNLNKI